MDWYMKSVVAMLLMTPFFILANAFGRLGNKPEAMMFYWFVATFIGIGFWMVYTGQVKDLVPNKQLMILFAIGIACGAVGNILIVQAIVESSNPGLPVAIVGTNSLVIFMLTPLLAVVAPKYFQHIRFDWISLLGILLVVGGIFLISIKR